jgi:hypothetical protein
MKYNPLEKQEGGNHYKDMAIQVVEYCHKNGIGYMEGNVIKYVSRWRKKGGMEDLRKARHYIELLMQMENEAIQTSTRASRPSTEEVAPGVGSRDREDFRRR